MKWRFPYTDALFYIGARSTTKFEPLPTIGRLNFFLSLHCLLRLSIAASILPKFIGEIFVSFEKDRTANLWLTVEGIFGCIKLFSSCLSAETVETPSFFQNTNGVFWILLVWLLGLKSTDCYTHWLLDISFNGGEKINSGICFSEILTQIWGRKAEVKV